MLYTDTDLRIKKNYKNKARPLSNRRTLGLLFGYPFASWEVGIGQVFRQFFKVADIYLKAPDAKFFWRRKTP